MKKSLKLLNYNIFIVGGAANYANWLPEMDQVDSIEEADLVMFTGGADVDPALYGENVGKHTGINKSRDAQEIEVFNKCIELGKKMIGICRGSQFLTVMAGGRLIQHVTGHAIAGEHQLVIANGNKFNITSTHHQMLFPFNMDKKNYKILAYSSDKLSNTYLNGDNEEIELPKDFVEPEMVLYKNIDAFAIQGHPEMMSDKRFIIDTCREFVEEFLTLDFNPVKEPKIEEVKA